MDVQTLQPPNPSGPYPGGQTQSPEGVITKGVEQTHLVEDEVTILAKLGLQTLHLLTRELSHYAQFAG